ncbi:outer membrane usher protein [Morganella morganii]|uniref:outer membrane usher protein n=1 Tax=Morganella morganii TaxID=582 RepID=UPI0004682B32|nr:outer membrane usher protein [Morganella morganii]
MKANVIPSGRRIPRPAVRLKPLTFMILLSVFSAAVQAEDMTEFNTEVLDLNERGEIDLSQFSQAGYVMPGTYSLALKINNSMLAERQIRFLAPDNDPQGSMACITPAMSEELGLTSPAKGQLTWWHNGECADPASLPGMTLRADFAAGALRVSLPQAYLEYTAENWDPPSRWDEGIAGFILDYNLNGQLTKQREAGHSNRQELSGNGTTGLNAGAWRLRADWQGRYSRTNHESDQRWDWNRFYAYRAIAPLRAKLTLGENYLTSGMFDSFRYTGVALDTDDMMLPPNLRGYAPEVAGVAKTNARATVKQQGRVIYETTVAAGPFQIRDLSNALSGKLDVEVAEQDGTVQTFQVDAASVPYLTRPGLVRYKVALGKPSEYDHRVKGPEFISSEFSWGVSNGWSVYGGGLFAGKYTAVSAGIGRDLLMLGALSADITQSRASLPDGETKKGGSYRLSYSKRFDATNSQVTFAGYRFSERDFMTMSQYLNARYHNSAVTGNGKEMYTMTFSQTLSSLNTNVYLNFNHQTYWDRPASDNWNISASHYFDIGQVKNISLNLSAYRNRHEDGRDDGMYIGLSVPWGESGSMGYSGQFSKGQNSHSADYSDRINEKMNYRITAGMSSDHRTIGNGYLDYRGDKAEVTATAGFEGERYSAAGLSVRGGFTATEEGAALHRSGVMGGTRMLVDTGGVADVPVRGGGGETTTNIFGKAVVSDISNYYRNSVNVDLNQLGENAEATRSVVQGTLTEGAIGFRRFGIVSGQKAMAVLSLADGDVPPFGAVVQNREHIRTGMVSEDGMVWLSGINPEETMQVLWGGEMQCEIRFPETIPAGNLLLPCVSATKTQSEKSVTTEETPRWLTEADAGNRRESKQ